MRRSSRILPILLVLITTLTACVSSQQAAVPNSVPETGQVPVPVRTVAGDTVSLDEAQKRLLWSIPIPTYTIDNTGVAEVKVSYESWAPETRQLSLLYPDGLTISIWPQPDAPDFATFGAPFQSMEVKGNPGAGIEPGRQTNPEGTEVRYPGSITWWENDLVLTIYHETASLEELRKVAESMPEPIWAE